jgi:exonuclease VII large subunit
MVTVRNSDRPWFNSELRRETRKRDRIRKTAKKYNKQSDIDKYKKQKNKVNNLKKTAKEHFEQNLDTLILENISNLKTYWKITKMLIKSNKGYSNIPPLQNIIQDEALEEVVYEDDEKCELLNKYFF